MEEIIFKVRTSKNIPINWDLENQQKFPVHEHYLFGEREFRIVYKFKPTTKFDKEKFIDFYRHQLKKEFNACKVIVLKDD
tara:strand:- start:90583 stop:90822 length:240 start_codon:yes stop_codon:yes gene_type:complete